MKLAAGLLSLALLGIVASKDERSFAVLRFTNKQLTQRRMDPIVSPGVASAHVHTIQGGSAFDDNSTGEDLRRSYCTNAIIKGDNSNYWFPSLYFYDGTFEAVEISYVNVYYFFDATDDKIKAFPTGLQMVAGDALTRTAPWTSSLNLDPSVGIIQPVKWTCPRSNYTDLSWPPGSDGSLAGIGDPVSREEGVGFPNAKCDRFASPLRADVHFPSCYDPEAGPTNYKVNTKYPTVHNTEQGQKFNCPDGWTHVPHLFLEVYWNTPLFDSRWDPRGDSQPFVLSNGDVTGFSLHADFMAGWDEDLLQHIIDTCDANDFDLSKGNGMENCPGLFYGTNSEECTIPSDQDVSGILDSLPGNNPLQGWRFGVD